MKFEVIKRAVTTGLVYAICVYFLYLSLIVSIITGVLVAVI